MKISIIEDHTEFRHSLEFIIGSFSDFQLMSSVGSVEAYLQQPADAEVLLLDINLPGMSGLDALPLLKKRFPGLKVIMLTILDDDQHIMTAICRGADGYILKKSQPQKILCIRFTKEALHSHPWWQDRSWRFFTNPSHTAPHSRKHLQPANWRSWR